MQSLEYLTSTSWQVFPYLPFYLQPCMLPLLTYLFRVLMQPFLAEMKLKKCQEKLRMKLHGMFYLFMKVEELFSHYFFLPRAGLLGTGSMLLARLMLVELITTILQYEWRSKKSKKNESSSMYHKGIIGLSHSKGKIIGA